MQWSKWGFWFVVLCSIVGQSSESSGAATLTLFSNYEFNNSYADTLGNGAELVPIGGSLGSGSFSFDLEDGLRLPFNATFPSFTDDDFRIELDLSFSQPFNTSGSGYYKLIDFKALTSEAGLYVYQSSAPNLRFFGANVLAQGTAVIPVQEPPSPSSQVTIGLSRTGDLVQIFVDGNLDDSFNDDQSSTDPFTNAKVELNFFVDDRGFGENTAGNVDAIRIFTPVPEPSAFLFVTLSMTITAHLPFRRKKGSV